MKLSKIELFVAQLLLLEGGQAPESEEYNVLRMTYGRLRNNGYTPASMTVDGLQPALYSLPLTAARSLWRDYYGTKGVDKMDGTHLRIMSYPDWLMALQRACWLPLCCDKMPYQQLSNVVADCVLFYADARVVLRQLLDILEQNRLLFRRPFDPLPPTEVITQQVTRRLYCQIRSTEVCNSVVRQLTDHRIAFIQERAATDALWARHADALIQRAERMAAANTFAA